MKITETLKNTFLVVMISALCLFFLPEMSHGDLMTAASGVATVAGILFGFVVATISIFISVNESTNQTIDALKKNNILNLIIEKLLSIGVMLLLASIFPLIAMFLPSYTLIFNKNMDFITLVLGLSCFILSLYPFYRSWQIMKRIFASI